MDTSSDDIPGPERNDWRDRHPGRTSTLGDQNAVDNQIPRTVVGCCRNHRAIAAAPLAMPPKTPAHRTAQIPWARASGVTTLPTPSSLTCRS